MSKTKNEKRFAAIYANPHGGAPIVFPLGATDVIDAALMAFALQSPCPARQEAAEDLGVDADVELELIDVRDIIEEVVS